MGARQWTASLVLVIIFPLFWLGGDGFYHQHTFLEPTYDEYGHEIGNERVLEMTDMRSTLLGYGYGLNYSGFDLDPFQDLFLPPFAGNGVPAPSFGFQTRQQHVQHQHQLALAPQMASQPRTSARRSPYAPPVSQSLRPTAHQVQRRGDRPYAPFHHRRFKRQASIILPGGSSLQNLLLEHLSKQPFDLMNPPFPVGLPLLPGDGQTVRERRPCRRPQQISCNTGSRFRTVDGLCNNLGQPKWGAAMQPLRRLHNYNLYLDGYDIPRLTSSVDRRRLLPSARLVSRLIHEPDRPGHAIPQLSNLLMQWGQFTDHDITGTPAHKDRNGDELRCCRNVRLTEDNQIYRDAFAGGPCHPIYIPPLDRHFRYSCMSFARSQPVSRKRDCDPRAPRQVREQMNMLTAFIDGSQIYGSSLKDNRKIRLYRHGMLRVTSLDLLPEDANVTCVKDSPGDYCFQAGEMRVNEHPALTTLHTIFHRLHNQIALALFEINPRWDDERIFQEARKIVGAILQHVTYHDWLPIVLGPDVMRETGLGVSGPFDNPSTSNNLWYYDRSSNPTIINSFATAAFRFGHTLIPSIFTVGSEKIRLHRMFNRPKFILRDGGESIKKFCHGLLTDSVQHVDRFISTDLSDRLFEDKHNMSMDLAALNIQRGRDHGLPGYNDFREKCGLPRIRSFDDFYKSEPERAEVFRRVYDHVDDIDLFSGGISETPMSGAVIGQTFGCIIAQQFRNLKFGDRYWYENSDRTLAFSPEQIREIRSYSLAKVLCTMAPLESILANVFYKEGAFLPKPVILITGETITQNRYVPCEAIKTIDMNAWRDAIGAF